MMKLKQFEEATLDLVLFGFDVLTTSDMGEGVETYNEDKDPHEVSVEF